MIKSNDELFQATRDLITSLEAKQSSSSALRLREGMRSLNGLTDGWALFLQSIECVQRECQTELDLYQEKRLKDIHAAVYAVVYRKKPKWWKFW